MGVDILDGGLVDIPGLGDGLLLYGLQGGAVFAVGRKQQKRGKHRQDDAGDKEKGFDHFLVVFAFDIFALKPPKYILKVH